MGNSWQYIMCVQYDEVSSLRDQQVPGSACGSFIKMSNWPSYSPCCASQETPFTLGKQYKKLGYSNAYLTFTFSALCFYSLGVTGVLPRRNKKSSWIFQRFGNTQNFEKKQNMTENMKKQNMIFLNHSDVTTCTFCDWFFANLLIAITDLFW